MKLKIQENAGVIDTKRAHTWDGNKIYTGCLKFEK